MGRWFRKISRRSRKWIPAESLPAAEDHELSEPLLLMEALRTGKAAPNAALSHKKRRYIHQNIGSGCSHRLQKIAIYFDPRSISSGWIAQSLS
jgi:hypothetical protein